MTGSPMLSQNRKIPPNLNYHMSIKKCQAILKCFYLKIPSLAFGLCWAQTDETMFCDWLRTIFSVRLPVKVFKTLSDRQSYILRKFHKSKKYPAKPSYHMLMIWSWKWSNLAGWCKLPRQRNFDCLLWAQRVGHQ